MFNTYSDAAPSIASERQEEALEQLERDKFEDIESRLSNDEHNALHILFGKLMGLDSLKAAGEIEEIMWRQAEREAIKEWESL